MLGITPNLGMKARVLYVVVGLAVIGGSFALGLEGWNRVVVPIVGVLVVATGKTGW